MLPLVEKKAKLLLKPSDRGLLRVLGRLSQRERRFLEKLLLSCLRKDSPEVVTPARSAELNSTLSELLTPTTVLQATQKLSRLNFVENYVQRELVRRKMLSSLGLSTNLSESPTR